MGKLMKSGVETETKSHRMVVLKDFTYLICDIGSFFDAKGKAIMNHGGITIDEVIVPFIKIKTMDVLESERVGMYSIKKHALANSEIVNFLLYVMMKIDDAGYYSLLNMENSMYLFPFEYKVSKEDIMEDDKFTMGIFGGEISFSLKG